MKTTDIKGKPYIEVNERIKYFRENFPNYSLTSEIVSITDGVCVIKAIITDENGVIKATGHAYEKEGSTFINKTSYIENCETSAWGRALGNLGIGIDTSVASADEVQNAVINQQNKPKETSSDFYECEQCKCKVFGVKDRTAEEMKLSCVEKYGQALCPKCAKEQ